MDTLRRSRDNSILFGLLGGFSEAVNIDTILLRIILAILFFTPLGPIVSILYLVFSFIVPLESVEWRDEKRLQRIEQYKRDLGLKSRQVRARKYRSNKSGLPEYDVSQLDEDEWSDF